ncbi:3'-5' exonuclease [Salinibacter altiplanensis]|uniref:3'-5' exonuclease n=1 Tax=Salinibacter altiplanensis TaxID=1803181 RepID=UPI000C9F2E86|nr:3'-5' exonuclease [Salinibacter altiplanensis]
MSQWTDRPLRTASLVFFDLETTALRPDRGGRICEMAVVDPQGVRFDWCSDEAPPRDDVVATQLPRLLNHLEAGIVVGHNLEFDFRFLTYEAERLGCGGLDLRFADTLGLARALLNAPDDYQLGTLLGHFDAAPNEELHTAVGDALATRALFWRLVETGGLETPTDANVRRLQWGAG